MRFLVRPKFQSPPGQNLSFAKNNKPSQTSNGRAAPVGSGDPVKNPKKRAEHTQVPSADIHTASVASSKGMRTKIQKLLLPRPKDNRPSVPGFPNLIRGSAPRDGDCFFHSVAGLAEATVRHHTQGEPDPVSMRRRIARNMIEEFQDHNVVQLQTSELQGQRQEPNSGPLHTAHGITTDPQGLYARLSDNSSLRQFPPVPDDNDPVWLTWLGSKLAVEQFKTLTPVQKGHVLNMATKGSFNNETADELPALTASAFPGLKIDVYVGYTADTTGTLSFFTSPDPDASKVQAMARVFLANAHYEPVFEKT